MGWKANLKEKAKGGNRGTGLEEKVSPIYDTLQDHEWAELN